MIIDMPRLKNIVRSLINRYFNVGAISREISKEKFYLRKTQLEDKILNCVNPGVSKRKYCPHEIIVSLTTYGRRLQDVCYTIESIMQQTMLPNRIVLNLDLPLEGCVIPIALQRQKERGLEIVEVEDIRSYKKLIPTLRSNPESVIITIDDDAIYEFDLIERLFNSYMSNPDKISALRTHTIIFDDNMMPVSYNAWDMCKDTADKPFRLFATGVGGVLYPPHSLADEVFNQDVFTSICPTADDVWFHAMAVLKGTETVRVPARNPDGCDYILNEEVQDMGLCTINTGEGGLNDPQIKAVYEKYGICDLLR